MSRRNEEIEYPPNCCEIPTGLSNNELVRRLKILSRELQELPQDAELCHKYTALSRHLARDYFLGHSSREVKILVACCIADLLRIFAPEAPYDDPQSIKEVLIYLIRQLRGLDSPTEPLYHKYYHLLENLVSVKSLTIAIDLVDCSEILSLLIKSVLSVVRVEHRQQIQPLLLELIAPLLHENDQVPTKVLDALFLPLCEPHKTQNREAFNLAKEIILRCETALDLSIQHYFNQFLMTADGVVGSEVNSHGYELLFELYHINPEMVFSVFPQLEFKFRSEQEKDRSHAVALIAKLLAEPESKLADDQPNLFSNFLGRFRDVSQAIRIKCIQVSPQIMLRHTALRSKFSSALQDTMVDLVDEVRQETVVAVAKLAKENIDAVDSGLMNALTQRTLDKKFKVRKEALMSIATLYRKVMLSEETTAAQKNRVAYIKNRILFHYSQQNLDDMLLCEKLLHTCLVPYLLETQKRMEFLLKTYCTIEKNPMKAFNFIVKNQLQVREYVRHILELHKEEESESRDTKIVNRIRDLGGKFTDPANTHQKLKEFYDFLAVDPRALHLLEFIVGTNYTTKQIENAVKELLTKVSQMTNDENKSSGVALQPTVKALLERCAPLMIDTEATGYLVSAVRNILDGQGAVESGVTEEMMTERGMELLLIVSSAFPFTFGRSDTLDLLVDFLKRGHPMAGQVAMMVIRRIGPSLQENFPEQFQAIIPQLVDFAKSGTAKEAKLAVKCIFEISEQKKRIPLFRDILQALKEHVNVHDQMAPTALSALRTIALVAPNDFAAGFKKLISLEIVEKLLLSTDALKEHVNVHDRMAPTALSALGTIALVAPNDFAVEFKKLISLEIVEKLLLSTDPHSELDAEDTEAAWLPIDELSIEVNAKIAAMKFLVRWLCGLQSNENQYVTSAVKMLTAIVDTKGDLRSMGLPPAEMGHLRLAAGCSLLKLAAAGKFFQNLISVQQFQTIAYLICDECPDVRIVFALKLHKKLESMALPLEYLAIFSLAPLIRPKTSETVKQFLKQMAMCIITNIGRRRSMMKRIATTQSSPTNFLPEYAMSHVVHLLAHYPKLESHEDVETLEELRECLWFILQLILDKRGAEGGNHHWVYRHFQDIKQCKDALNPEDEEANKKMWALADLGMLLVSYRVPSFVLKNIAFKSVLSRRCFLVDAKRGERNLEVYLPHELIDHEKRTHGSKKPAGARGGRLNASKAADTSKQAASKQRKYAPVATAEPVILPGTKKKRAGKNKKAAKPVPKRPSPARKQPTRRGRASKFVKDYSSEGEQSSDEEEIVEQVEEEEPENETEVIMEEEEDSRRTKSSPIKAGKPAAASKGPAKSRSKSPQKKPGRPPAGASRSPAKSRSKSPQKKAGRGVSPTMRGGEGPVQTSTPVKQRRVLPKPTESPKKSVSPAKRRMIVDEIATDRPAETKRPAQKRPSASPEKSESPKKRRMGTVIEDEEELPKSPKPSGRSLSRSPIKGSPKLEKNVVADNPYSSVELSPNMSARGRPARQGGISSPLSTSTPMPGRSSILKKTVQSLRTKTSIPDKTTILSTSSSKSKSGRSTGGGPRFVDTTPKPKKVEEVQKSPNAKRPTRTTKKGGRKK